jgi:hypothetical protein
VLHATLATSRHHDQNRRPVFRAACGLMCQIIYCPGLLVTRLWRSPAIAGRGDDRSRVCWSFDLIFWQPHLT